jgi:hypothetical protein
MLVLKVSSAYADSYAYIIFIKICYKRLFVVVPVQMYGII